jgi:hypothetical protein
LPFDLGPHRPGITPALGGPGAPDGKTLASGGADATLREAGNALF